MISWAGQADHPRSRGEYGPTADKTSRPSGSSPLSRGIQVQAASCRINDGIIPALAGNTPTPARPLGLRRDHPRSRGEYSSPPGPAESHSGSSPLSRGILVAAAIAVAIARIIPALAGNTPHPSCNRRRHRDHPRSRGEYDLVDLHETGIGGSSPLSRGIRPEITECIRDGRIIPALAGNTERDLGGRAEGTDHPRSRGEYLSPSSPTSWWGGSSPLSRGILTATNQCVIGDRIIPALAGNTSTRMVIAFTRQDHPRSRGEYVWGTLLGLVSLGSSPLSRGIPCACRLSRQTDRIIPALAGNTTHDAVFRARGRDHPRSRGEYLRASAAAVMRLGSSPLSRGIHGSQLAPVVWRRIIPALAGNTRVGAARPCRGQDHPRSRGEYLPGVMPLFPLLGSSPLSRGILRSLGPMLRRGGIIPALAGNTRGP